jgi:hypothetical protein
LPTDDDDDDDARLIAGTNGHRATTTATATIETTKIRTCARGSPGLAS